MDKIPAFMIQYGIRPGGCLPTSRKGSCAFQKLHAIFYTWNCLPTQVCDTLTFLLQIPPYICNADSLSCFKSSPKMHLFQDIFGNVDIV